MDDATRSSRLRTLAWLPLPLTVIVLIPWVIRRAAHESFQWEGTLWQWLGIWLIANGLGLAAWCVNLFNVQGQGTPLPLDPPKRFVVKGPYRFLRNPMMLGALLIVAGQALVYRSAPVALYGFGLMLVAHLFIVCWEEPDLVRRFGPTYCEYRQQVPRWIPRLPHRP